MWNCLCEPYNNMTISVVLILFASPHARFKGSTPFAPGCIMNIWGLNLESALGAAPIVEGGSSSDFRTDTQLNQTRHDWGSFSKQKTYLLDYHNILCSFWKVRHRIEMTNWQTERAHKRKCAFAVLLQINCCQLHSLIRILPFFFE